MSKSNLLSIFDTESQSEKGAVLHLRHPSSGELMFADEEEKKPLLITLKGSSSTTFDKELERRKRTNKNKTLNADEIKLQTCEVYAKLTIGWSNIGVDFSFDEAVNLYMTYKDIREQVGDFIGKKSNFIQG